MISSDPTGYNPLRWDCSKRGCFNLKKRPKIERFKDCFPGKISFGDVDAIVEIRGKGLMLEWKEAKPPFITKGQQIMFERLTVGKLLTVICAAGNPESMEVWAVAWFYDGRFIGWKSCDFNGLKARIAAWVKKALKRDLPV